MNLMNDLKSTKMYNHYQVITLDGDTYNQCYATPRAIVFKKEKKKGNLKGDYKLNDLLINLINQDAEFKAIAFYKNKTLFPVDFTILIDNYWNELGLKVNTHVLKAALKELGILKISSNKNNIALSKIQDYLCIKNLDNEFVLIKLNKINKNDNINRFDKMMVFKY